jgi:hypothetical protein
MLSLPSIASAAAPAHPEPGAQSAKNFDLPMAKFESRATA